MREDWIWSTHTDYRNTYQYQATGYRFAERSGHKSTCQDEVF
jgi:hypothetical protein